MSTNEPNKPAGEPQPQTPAPVGRSDERSAKQTSDSNQTTPARWRRFWKFDEITIWDVGSAVLAVVAMVLAIVSTMRTRSLPDLTYRETIRGRRAVPAAGTTPARTIRETRIDVANRGGTEGEDLRFEFAGCGRHQLKVIPEALQVTSRLMEPRAGDKHVVFQMDLLPPQSTAVMELTAEDALPAPRGWMGEALPADFDEPCRVVVAQSKTAPVIREPGAEATQSPWSASELSYLWRDFSPTQAEAKQRGLAVLRESVATRACASVVGEWGSYSAVPKTWQSSRVCPPSTEWLRVMLLVDPTELALAWPDVAQDLEPIGVTKEGFTAAKAHASSLLRQISEQLQTRPPQIDGSGPVVTVGGVGSTLQAWSLPVHARSLEQALMLDAASQRRQGNTPTP